MANIRKKTGHIKKYKRKTKKKNNIRKKATRNFRRKTKSKTRQYRRTKRRRRNMKGGDNEAIKTFGMNNEAIKTFVMKYFEKQFFDVLDATTQSEKRKNYRKIVDSIDPVLIDLDDKQYYIKLQRWLQDKFNKNDTNKDYPDPLVLPERFVMDKETGQLREPHEWEKRTVVDKETGKLREPLNEWEKAGTKFITYEEGAVWARMEKYFSKQRSVPWRNQTVTAYVDNHFEAEIRKNHNYLEDQKEQLYENNVKRIRNAKKHSLVLPAQKRQAEAAAAAPDGPGNIVTDLLMRIERFKWNGLEREKEKWNFHYNIFCGGGGVARGEYYEALMTPIIAYGTSGLLPEEYNRFVAPFVPRQNAYDTYLEAHLKMVYEEEVKPRDDWFELEGKILIESYNQIMREREEETAEQTDIYIQLAREGIPWEGRKEDLTDRIDSYSDERKDRFTNIMKEAKYKMKALKNISQQRVSIELSEEGKATLIINNSGTTEGTEGDQNVTPEGTKGDQNVTTEGTKGDQNVTPGK